jgi:hypothetical protein
MIGICRLCEVSAELQESHIIPAFVFRWRKETAPTPFMRTSHEPNRRVQDGLKLHWLCRNCEQALSAYEKQFADTIFHPITQDDRKRISYGAWLLKFCVSISWRVLLDAQEETSFGGLSEAQRLVAAEALCVWHEFLRGRVPHPGKFEQHLLVFDEIGSYGGPLPPNFYRYALRSIDMDVGSNDDLAFTYVKMGPFVLLGFLLFSNPHEWSGGAISLFMEVMLRNWPIRENCAMYIIFMPPHNLTNFFMPKIIGQEVPLDIKFAYSD